jgi:hypothetical protein
MFTVQAIVVTLKASIQDAYNKQTGHLILKGKEKCWLTSDLGYKTFLTIVFPVQYKASTITVVHNCSLPELTPLSR